MMRKLFVKMMKMTTLIGKALKKSLAEELFQEKKMKVSKDKFYTAVNVVLLFSVIALFVLRRWPCNFFIFDIVQYRK